MADRANTRPLEYRTIDKSDWGPGPWQKEPDKVQYIDEATGLDCLIVRQPNHGALCGYVGVPPEHSFHGKDHEQVGCQVHGGLTYADSCQEGATSTSICHVPAPGRPDNVWWFGFDCAHAFDVQPARMAREAAIGLVPRRIGGYRELDAERYRDIEYVRGEIASLAKQLAAVA